MGNVGLFSAYLRSLRVQPVLLGCDRECPEDKVEEDRGAVPAEGYWKCGQVFVVGASMMDP